MKGFTLFFGVLIAAASPSVAADPQTPRDQAALERIVSELDSAVFDSFNRCSDPEQLARHAAQFDEAVEFYHDNGGVTWTREEMIDRTRDNACGNYRRELVVGSLKVFPINRFGAIAQGSHRFCQSSTGACDGVADFVMIWRETDGNWQITRVLSYGHRASGP